MIPPYTVRRSERAKHPRIVINSKGGTPNLEVVLPRKFSEEKIPGFVKQHEIWIEKSWRKQTARVEETFKSREIPDEIKLLAIDETWKIARNSLVPESQIFVELENMTLKFSTKTSDASFVLLIKQWLCDEARIHIVPRLGELAERFNFKELRGVSVRCQKTLWGSCSATGSISLNSKLLFLPPNLVRHILLHELCHLREMNHSARFHKLLDSLDPEAKKKSALIRNQWAYVPRWIELA